MHTPTATPACYLPAGQPVPARAPWSYDQGRGCGNALEPESWAVALRHTPTCAGCARAAHALAVRAKLIQALPCIRTARQPEGTP